MIIRIKWVFMVFIVLNPAPFYRDEKTGDDSGSILEGNCPSPFPCPVNPIT